MPTVAAVADYLQELAPLSLAAEWDNVGLLLGDACAPIERVMTCLTLTPETAAEAIERRAQLIVAHHPILFKPIQRVTSATLEGRLLLALATANVAVYSAHTAWDDAPVGINYLLAQRLGLTEIGPLRKGDGPRQCKMVVFVPDADLAKVSEALFAAGAGRIGQYRECSYRLAGTGTFFGSNETNPTLGQKGRREEVNEWRLETICPELLVDRAVAEMRRAHSYEEPAFDVYPLRPHRAGGQGRVGNLPAPRSLRAVAETMKQSLGTAYLQLVGELEQPIRRIAVACGAAGTFLTDAVRQKADLFLTGEARFHECLASKAQGIALLLPGHYATERFGMESLADCLRHQFTGLDLWASERERDPLSFL